jgi:GT2 family glycosyltransferase
LVFLDDDMSVSRDFLSAYQRAHREWPAAMLVGAIGLPDKAGTTPFGGQRSVVSHQPSTDIGQTSAINHQPLKADN